MIEKLKELQQLGQVFLAANSEGRWVCRATFVVQRRKGALLTCRAESSLTTNVEEAVADCYRVAFRDYEEAQDHD